MVNQLDVATDTLLVATPKLANSKKARQGC